MTNLHHLSLCHRRIESSTLILSG